MPFKGMTVRTVLFHIHSLVVTKTMYKTIEKEKINKYNLAKLIYACDITKKRQRNLVFQNSRGDYKLCKFCLVAT